MKRLLTAICLSMPLLGFAQERTYLLGIGNTSLLDTYLSPEHYSGTEIRLLQLKEKPLKKDPLWLRTTMSQEYLSVTNPRSDNANELAGMFEFSYGMCRRFDIAPNFSVAAGGQADVFIGGVYNTRNGNNPAQLKLGFDIAPAFKATYRFNVKRKDMRLEYRGRLPIAGLQFSPAYGQSYYEIFSQGDYDHNVCFASPFNALSYSNMLTLGMRVKKAFITVGYLGDWRQAKFNGLKYHSFTHSFVIGYTL